MRTLSKLVTFQKWKGLYIIK